MEYKNIIPAKFIERPNRFVAYCEINGKVEKCHVKNTGRCKELLIKGTTVYLEESDNPERKTKFSLVSVENLRQIINIDSQSPNKVVYEALEKGFTPFGVTGKVKNFKKEVTFQNSRFDIFLETEHEQGFIEIKGVTLKHNKIAMFPDAPTERGTKHVLELIEAKRQGYFASVFFLLQMTNCSVVTPNHYTDPKFANAIHLAKKAGVIVQAYDSVITPNSITIGEKVPVLF